MARNKCKYCGSKSGSSKICSACYEKLRLIRKLLKMVRDTYGINEKEKHQ